MKSYFTVLSVALLLAFVAGCSPLPAIAPQAAATLPPATVPPPTAVPTAVPSPAPKPFADLAEWKLLVISDASNYRVGEAYAKLIEADMGVKVKLYDCGSMDMPITEALAQGQGTSNFTCDANGGNLIRDAEVIVLYGNPTGSRPPGGAWDGSDSWLNCVLQPSKWQGMDPTKLAASKANIAKSCAPETFAKYRADWAAALEGIFKLRAGRPVILRATDMYIPNFTAWDSGGVTDACVACMENYVQAIHEVAAEYGVPVASTMDAFNGPDRRSDPSAKGYTDGLGVLTAAGAERLAQAIEQTGYGYAGK